MRIVTHSGHEEQGGNEAGLHVDGGAGHRVLALGERRERPPRAFAPPLPVGAEEAT